MYGEASNFNEYKKDDEKPSWHDIPAYAKSILLENGSDHSNDERSFFDYRWTDPQTDDQLRLSCTGLDEGASYCLEVEDGSKVDYIRRYGFWFNQAGIYVYDENRNRIPSEEIEQTWLQTYVNGRLRTSGVHELAISNKGTHVFWQLAGRLAITDTEVDTSIRRLLSTQKGLADAHHDYIIEQIRQRAEYATIPTRFISAAIVQRLLSMRTTNQPEQ